MAEMQRKKEKEKKRTESVDILGSVLDEVTSKQSQPQSPDLQQISADVSRPPISQPIVQPKTHTPPITKPAPVKPADLQPGVVDPRVKPVLPAWVAKPWRWMVPEEPQLKQQWLTTWGEFILDFARVLNYHILDLQEVALVYPFQNPLLKKKLTLPQLVMISEYLIEIERAAWWDDEQTRLRVYWKTLKSHSDELFEYAFQNGMIWSQCLILSK